MRWLFIAGLVCACDGGGMRAPAHETAPAPASITWHDDIAPLVQRHCVGCHFAGGVGPMRLDTFADATLAGPLALGAIDTGLMPPWMPSADCAPLANARRLSDDERAAFRAWVEAGMPEGAPGPTLAPVVDATQGFVASETHVVADAYVPAPTGAMAVDDYHCFVLDRTFDEDTYVVGSNVAPGSGQVHHAIVYAIKPAQLAEMEARDAATPEPGYPCFAQPISTGFAGQSAFIDYLAGGPLPNFDFPIQLGAWVPGIAPRVLPPGMAYRVPAGSKLVVQVHYSLQGAPVADDTRLSLMTTRTPPRELVRTRPLAVLDLDIPAGDPAARITAAFPYYGDAPLELIGGMAHMHLLGSAFDATLERARVVDAGDASDAASADGPSASECLLDIPRWDFHWQESYAFADGLRIPVRDGDRIAVSCEYDNSAAHQALGPDGLKPAPRDVEWGESTRDEMCIYYYSSVHPFVAEPDAPPATPCEPAAGCFERCRESDAASGEAPSLDCVLACGEASTECQLCSVRAALQCSGFTCLGTLAASSDCLTMCLEASLMLGSNLGRCLEAECHEGYDAALQCLDSQLPSCDQRLAGCGVSFAASTR